MMTDRTSTILDAMYTHYNIDSDYDDIVEYINDITADETANVCFRSVDHTATNEAYDKEFICCEYEFDDTSVIRVYCTDNHYICVRESDAKQASIAVELTDNQRYLRSALSLLDTKFAQ